MCKRINHDDTDDNADPGIDDFDWIVVEGRGGWGWGWGEGPFPGAPAAMWPYVSLLSQFTAMDRWCDCLAVVSQSDRIRKILIKL